MTCYNEKMNIKSTSNNQNHTHFKQHVKQEIFKIFKTSGNGLRLGLDIWLRKQSWNNVQADKTVDTF